MWKDLFSVKEKQGRIRTAIDGCSEKLRYKYGKKISNEDIKHGIEHIGSFGGNTVLLVYNICNMPGETIDDKKEMEETIRSANPKNRIIVVIQSTPFRPSLLTPMQWSPVKLYPNWNKYAADLICERSNLRAIHSFSNESNYSQLVTVVIDRAIEETDELFNAICFSPKLRNGLRAEQKIKLIERNFDLSIYLKEYQLNEIMPANYLKSHLPENRIKKLYAS